MRSLTLRSRVLPLALLMALVVATGQFGQVTAQDDAPGAAGSLPIFGMLVDGSGEVGTFQGTVSDLVASSADDELSLDGLVSGLAVIDGDTVRVTDQEFSSVVEPEVVSSIDEEDYTGEEGDDDATPIGGGEGPVQAYVQTANDPGKCDVLFLNIQPITLNLLGLEVLTSPITIDVNAIPGEGNLLGNLVCSLAGLLDGTPDAVAEITDQLNQVLSGAGVAPAAGTEPPQATPVT